VKVQKHARVTTENPHGSSARRLAIIARSSNHAPNQHDADCATFHRVKNFRKLALNLVPEPEGK
jgi:hypothetical protein